MTYCFFTWMDASGEKATASFMLPEIAADGANYATITGLVSTLKSALQAVTQGTIQESALVAFRTRHGNAIPDDGRRESKWLVRYEDDSTFKVYNFEIPCSDRSLLPMQTGTDFVDLAYATPGALKTALDNLISGIQAMKSPTNGSITVISIQDVGRNT